MTAQCSGTKGVLPGSPRHFGQSGTFLWIDPVAGVACVALTDRAFGPWAVEAWTPFTDAVLAEVGNGV
jgi:CubicO group peptidase (beta-lactamase class C family)